SPGQKEQECYCHQVFIDKDDDLIVPTVQQLVEHSFHSNHLKLAEVPSCFIIQMPRFGKNYKMFEKIIPSLELDVTDLLCDSPRECCLCGELATQECEECFKDKLFSKTGLKQYCDMCWRQVHYHSSRRSHGSMKLDCPVEFARTGKAMVPREKMQLFAVLCIETSHYVSFIKYGPEDHQWMFFDSMSDRHATLPEQLLCKHYLCSNCIEDIQSKGAGQGVVDCPLCSSMFPLDPSQVLTPGVPSPDKLEEAAAFPGPAAGPPSCGDDATEGKVCDPLLGKPSPDLAEKRCQEHNEALEFYCEDDGECVCGPCTTTGNHKSHSLMSFEKAAAQIKDKVLNSVKSLLQTQQGYHFKYQDLQKSEEELKMQVGRLQGNLSKKFMAWRSSLEEDEENVLRMIDEEANRLTSKSSSCSKTLNDKMDLIRQIDDAAQDLTKCDRLEFLE
ncbi:hypothetical protein scyTo_0020601, partial [Scyliorhinus torazame]|nr:hypothetical protein [Scyliorhinus torazame]